MFAEIQVPTTFQDSANWFVHLCAFFCKQEVPRLRMSGHYHRGSKAHTFKFIQS